MRQQPRIGFSISKHREGNYTLFLYDSEPEIVREVERRMRMNDRVLRFLSVRADDAELPTPEQKSALEASRAEAKKLLEDSTACQDLLEGQAGTR